MIAVNGLSYRYKKAKSDALKGISFDIDDGEIFGFLGPSGAGKSTTQRILTGSLTGYAGSASVNGHESSKADGAYRQGIGVCFEFPCFYEKLTGLENLRLFASMYGGEQEDALALLARLGIGDAADKRVAAYSKGMRVRLNVARSLMHRPRTLFLDEPTSGLDPTNARVVMQLIREHARDGCSVFVTTHDMGVADALCDRVAFLVDGTIAACDAPMALKRRYGKPAVAVERSGAMASAAEGGKMLEFPLEGLADNQAFLAELRRPGLTGVRTMDASLEKIFVELTGRSLV